MMRRIVYVLLSVALVCGLLLFFLPQAACQADLKEVPSPTAEGKVLNLYGIDPLTLDPAVSNDLSSQQYVGHLFSGLVRLDANLEPVPDIAQRWEISSDGRTYTFFLRQNVSFHQGRKVKADDFKYSWQRACDPVTGSLTAATYLGDIVGTSEVLAGKSKELSGVRVINDYTLEVTIDAPKSYFLSKLTHPAAFVVDRVNVKSGSGWWRHPNGTGPFKLGKWDENRSLVLERNELYYGRLAQVNSVVFHLWGGVPMDMYETGKIDVIGVSPDYVDKVADMAGPFYEQLAIIPELSFSYIGFNYSKPPFDDVNSRRAFSQAIDKDKLVSLVFRDTVQRADGILPPGLLGFKENLSGLDYDVNKAKQLIRESKYGDVSRLPLITITTSGWGGLISPELEAIIHEWRHNLGVEVKVRQLEPLRFLYYLMEEKDEMFYSGWVADYPHPQDFLEVLFHSGADNNYGEYSNPEIDNLLVVARAEPDNKLNLALYQKVEQKLVEDAAVIPLWFGRNYMLVKPYVRGYRVNPLGFARLNMVSVESR